MKERKNDKNIFRVYRERGYQHQQFSSLNAQLKTEASKRDDMEALGYILIFFLRGDLPWLNNEILKLGELDFFHCVSS